MPALYVGNLDRKYQWLVHQIILIVHHAGIDKPDPRAGNRAIRFVYMSANMNPGLNGKHFSQEVRATHMLVG